MRRILVLRGGALGDLIVTLPALESLRSRWPDARIELIGNATAGELARASGLVDAVHSQHEARWSALFAAETMPAVLKTWLEAFDLVLNFWPDTDGALSRTFPLHRGQIFLSASAMPNQAPASAHFQRTLERLEITPSSPWFDLSARLEAVAKTKVLSVAIHPGSGSSRKNWPLDRWTKLAHWLREEWGAAVFVVSGEVETDGLLADSGQPWRNLPLLELAGRLQTCWLFLGHDSGVSHLAAALRVPAILLFGPTDPAMWAPPALHVRVLKRGEQLASISLEDATSAVTRALSSLK